MDKQEIVALIVEYVRNDDAMECDFVVVETAMENVDTSELKPTSTINRLLLSTDWYINAGPGNEAREFYREMAEAVELIEAGI